MSNRFQTIASAVLSMIALACGDVPPTGPVNGEAGPSFGTVLLNEAFPVAGTLLNPCPPEEDVTFEGRLHVLIKGTPDDFTVHTNGQSIQGVGLISGDRYVLMEHENSETRVTGTTATHFFNLRFHMVRQGREDNFWYKLVLRATFLPDGTAEVEIVEEDIECRG